MRVPRKAAKVGVLVQAAEGGWLGSVDLDREMLAEAPEAPTPGPPCSAPLKEARLRLNNVEPPAGMHLRQRHNGC
jgi:hypothetical protein